MEPKILCGGTIEMRVLRGERHVLKGERLMSSHEVYQEASCVFQASVRVNVQISCEYNTSCLSVAFFFILLNNDSCDDQNNKLTCKEEVLQTQI